MYLGCFYIHIFDKLEFKAARWTPLPGLKQDV